MFTIAVWEAFEHVEIVKRARHRIDKTVEESYKRSRDFRNNKALKVGRFGRRGAGTVGTDYAGRSEGDGEQTPKGGLSLEERLAIDEMTTEE